jgi:hypothetical protein
MFDCCIVKQWRWLRPCRTCVVDYVVAVFQALLKAYVQIVCRIAVAEHCVVWQDGR